MAATFALAALNDPNPFWIACITGTAYQKSQSRQVSACHYRLHLRAAHTSHKFTVMTSSIHRNANRCIPSEQEAGPCLSRIIIRHHSKHGLVWLVSAHKRQSAHGYKYTLYRQVSFDVTRHVQSLVHPPCTTSSWEQTSFLYQQC